MPLATIQRRHSLAERVQRSQQLRAQWSFAAEFLKTYELVVQFQQSLSVALHKSSRHNHSHRRLPRELDLSPFLLDFHPLLLLTMESTAEAMATPRHQVQGRNSEWEHLLHKYWCGTYNGNDATEGFLLHAFLQPIAEHLAANREIPPLQPRLAVCPFCERKPVCGILRPEADGAKRSLLCSFCSTEWDYRRLVCPACEQEDIDKLPVYTAEQFPYIRIEACDACHSFIKTIDLTKDGRPIPVVDEIASLPLTLWAQQKHYRKLQPNLLLM